MSFAAAQARLMMLISEQYDIELQTQFILQHKMFLDRAVGGFMNLKSDYEPGSKADKALEARIFQLNEAEKELEIKLQSLKSRGEAISRERDATEKLIGQNAERTFTNPYGMGGGR